MGRKQDELMHNFVVGRYPEMRRAAYLMCGDWQRSETLAKATLAKIVAGRRRRAHNLDPLARRELMNAFRTGWRGPFRRREHLFHSLADPADDARRGRSGRLDPFVKVSLLAALHQLPPRRRAVVVLHHWERLTLQETARTLKMSLRAVRAHSDAGLAALRAVARDLLRDPAAAAPNDPVPAAAALTDPGSTRPDSTDAESTDAESTDPDSTDPDSTDAASADTVGTGTPR
jgi:DNA-directed RNA polymerase specialized sigma24 family protein